jgi:hypothetical protein
MASLPASSSDSPPPSPSLSSQPSSSSSLPPIPHLLVTGVTTPLNDCQSLLSKKGFILKYSLQEQAKAILVLEISPKLHVKLAISNDFPVVNRHLSAEGDVTRIIHLSQQILKKSGLKYEESWLMNQHEKVSPPLPSLFHTLLLLLLFLACCSGK